MADPHPAQAAGAGDDSTNDLLVSEVIRTNERQVWFVAEHLVDTPLTAHKQQLAAAWLVPECARERICRSRRRHALAIQG